MHSNQYTGGLRRNPNSVCAISVPLPGSGALGGSVLGSSALGDGVLGDLDIILLRYFRLSLLDETGTLLDPVIVF